MLICVTVLILNHDLFSYLQIDQYQCNERDKNWDYFQCPAANRILIMQNNILSIILIHEVIQIYDLSSVCFKSSNYH